MTGKTYIVITNFTGGWPHTIECLESVYRLDYPDYQIIVVDDGSRDESVQFIIKWARGEFNPSIPFQNPLKLQPLSPEARNRRPAVFHDLNFQPAEKNGQETLIVIQSSINRGFAGANNLGLQYALQMGGFEYVWLLNNDTIVERTALSHLVSRMKEKPAAGLCGSTLLYYNFPGRVQTYGGVRFNRWTGLGKPLGCNSPLQKNLSAEDIEKQMDYVYGSSMLVSKDFLLDIGLMSEEYFIYFEEIDWSMRARGKFTLAFAPESLVYHKAGTTVGGGYREEEKNSLFSDYYYFKNMIRFTRKFFAWALPVVTMRILVMLLQKIVGRQWSSAGLLIKTLLRIPVDVDKLWDKR